MKLLTPDVAYERQYREMISIWRATVETPAPWVLDLDDTDFPRLVADLLDWSKGVHVQEGWVPSATFWLYDEEGDKLLGAVNIRLELNDSFLQFYGTIGYGVRPDERGKGYATQALRLALDYCRGLGHDRELLCCHSNNGASARVIEKSGGVLENEVPVDGYTMQRYWITL